MPAFHAGDSGSNPDISTFCFSDFSCFFVVYCYFCAAFLLLLQFIGSIAQIFF